MAPEPSVSLAGGGPGTECGQILQLPEGCCQDGDKPRWGWRALQPRLPGPRTQGSPRPGEGASASGGQRAVAHCSLCTRASSSLSLSAASPSPGLGGTLSISQVRRRPGRWRAAGSGFTPRAGSAASAEFSLDAWLPRRAAMICPLSFLLVTFSPSSGASCELASVTHATSTVQDQGVVGTSSPRRTSRGPCSAVNSGCKGPAFC